MDREPEACFYPANQPHWTGARYGPSVRLPEFSANDEYLRKHGRLPAEKKLPQWFTSLAFAVPDKHGMNHLMACLSDNTSHNLRPDEVLRSEITTAVNFIKVSMKIKRIHVMIFRYSLLII